MAIDQKDLDIQNISYTNKTFDQIYPELIDLAKQISTKWDPEYTNESDPGIVLIKLMAFMGDKLNYNIDKNTLEQFVTSATQENSFDKIIEMMGYNRRYYRSATSYVSFYYKGGNEALDEQLDNYGQVTLQPFSTTFKTEDGLVYTLLEPMEITSEDPSSLSKLAMQGELTSLVIDGASTGSSGATKVQLYNLDDQRRVYFSDSQVSENGIFINKKYYDDSDVSVNNEDAWKRVDNLYDQDINQKIYKFGYDSDKELPYLEFPEDITNLIGDGIEIWYLITDGEAGYASNNSLTELNSWSFTSLSGATINDVGSFDSSYYSLSNSSSVGAEDVETIDEAYSGFKKTVGTFDTLVSCRDYSNAINRQKDDITNDRLVSNVQIADVRTDPNKAIPILMRTGGVASSFGFEILDEDINRNALYVHGMNPINVDINSKSRYNNTYNLITSAQILDIDGALTDIKTLCHTFEKVADDDIDFILENAVLRVNISTTTQVNDSEQNSIINNVKSALYENFNAGELDFGTEIPYEILYKVILNADSRISLVTFDDPALTPYIVTGDGKKERFNPNDTSSSDLQLEILVNNILAGRISLYGIDSSFNYTYDMNLSTLKGIDKLAFVKGETSFELTPEEKTIPDNTTIQIIEDSYLETLEYEVNCYYSYITDREEGYIPKNSVYKMQQGENLYIYYTSADQEKTFVKYKEGDVVKANFNLYKTVDAASGTTKATRWADSTFSELVDEGTTNAIPLFALASDENIYSMSRNETTLDKNNQACFWNIKPRIINGEITNEEGALIFTKDATTGKFVYILEEGEFFIYPNANKTTLFVQSTGTKLEIESDASEFVLYKQNNTDYISEEEIEAAIEEADVGRFEKSIKWENVNFKYNPLTIIESSIHTFIEGEEVHTDGETIGISSDWQYIENSVTIEGNFDGETSKWIYSNITDPRIRAILRIRGEATDPQMLEENQSITIGYLADEDEETIAVEELKEGESFQIYPAVNSYGDVVLRTPDIEETEEEGEYVYSGYQYLYSLIKYDMYEGSTDSGTQGALLNLIDTHASTLNSRDEYSFTLSQLYEAINDDEYTLKILLSLKADKDLYISVFNNYNFKTDLYEAIKSGDEAYILLDFSDLYKELSLEEWNQYAVYISLPKNLAINPLLSSELDEDTLTRIKNKLSKHTTFDYLGVLNSAKLIGSYDLINSFFDYNNLYNPFTIEKIDFDNSEFTIVGSSRKVYDY